MNNGSLNFLSKLIEETSKKDKLPYLKVKEVGESVEFQIVMIDIQHKVNHFDQFLKKSYICCKDSEGSCAICDDRQREYGEGKDKPRFSKQNKYVTWVFNHTTSKYEIWDFSETLLKDMFDMLKDNNIEDFTQVVLKLKKASTTKYSINLIFNKQVIKLNPADIEKLSPLLDLVKPNTKAELEALFTAAKGEDEVPFKC